MTHKLNKTNNGRVATAKVSRLRLVREGLPEAAPSIPEAGQKYVDVNNIIPDPQNERKTFRHMEGLIASSKTIGLVEPPTVTPAGNGKYMLVTGERRWRAAKAAGLKRIHVLIRSPGHDPDRRLKSLLSNIQRADLGPIELAQALHNLREDRPDIKTNRDLARLIGKSETWTSHMLSILTLPKDLQEQIIRAERTIPYDVVQQIARIQNRKLQAELIQKAAAGASVRDIREYIAAHKGKPAKTIRSASHKIQTSNATVTIRHQKPTPTQQDHIQALNEARTKIDNERSYKSIKGC